MRDGHRLEEIGAVIQRKIISTSYKTAMRAVTERDREHVVIQFQTQFEYKASVIETITIMKDDDGIWRVGGYYWKSGFAP